MIGSLNIKKRDVKIIGGGIAGLLAAYTLERSGYEVTLIEAQENVGGLIRTEMTPWGIAESAAHSLWATTPVRKLCRELSVDLIPVQPEAKTRYVLRDGKVRRFPLNWAETIEALGRAIFVRSKVEQQASGMTVGEWGNRFLGKAASRYLLTPMTRGIFGAGPDEIRLDAAFPSLAVPDGRSFLGHQLLIQWEKQWHKLRERPLMMAPRAGMGSLVQALALELRKRLKNRFQTGHTVHCLPEAGNIILAVPAPVAANLLVETDPDLAQALRGVHYTPLVCVTVFVKRGKLKNPPQGIGALAAEGERFRSLGVLFNSSAFEGRTSDPQAWVSFSVFLGGSGDPQILECSDEEIQKLVQAELRAVVGLRGNPEGFVISRQRNAIPRYDGKLVEAIEMAKAGWCSRAGCLLFGNYTGQVSIRGMIETMNHFQRESAF